MDWQYEILERPDRPLERPGKKTYDRDPPEREGAERYDPRPRSWTAPSHADTSNVVDRILENVKRANEPVYNLRYVYEALDGVAAQDVRRVDNPRWMTRNAWETLLRELIDYGGLPEERYLPYYLRANSLFSDVEWEDTSMTLRRVREAITYFADHGPEV